MDVKRFTRDDGWRAEERTREETTQGKITKVVERLVERVPLDLESRETESRELILTSRKLETFTDGKLAKTNEERVDPKLYALNPVEPSVEDDPVMTLKASQPAGEPLKASPDVQDLGGGVVFRRLGDIPAAAPEHPWWKIAETVLFAIIGVESAFIFYFLVLKSWLGR